MQKTVAAIIPERLIALAPELLASHARLQEALTEARGFVSSDYTGSGGKDLSNGALARIDAALDSIPKEIA